MEEAGKRFMRAGKVDIGSFLREESGRVSRPGRYLGIEVNAFRKPPAGNLVNCVLVYPDVYEIGMSHLGLAVLYEEINLREDCMADRAYLPWVDMQERMAARDVPLFGLESGMPLASFDVLGITLQHELTYANVIRVLELSGIPLRSVDRGDEEVLVVGGGPGAFNPEPIAEVFDLVVLGEGEEIIHELLDLVAAWKKGGKRRREGFLKECASLEGVYVPRFYTPRYREDGTVAGVDVEPGCPLPVKKRVVKDLNRFLLPRRPPVPLVESVHDRCSVEIFRGCTRGCRFCQAGMIYRPVRERDEELLYRWAWELVRNTGCEEISLSSLNSADYSAVLNLAERLSTEMERERVAVSLPSLRTDTFSVELASRLRRVRHTGITMAPEAGSERLRRIINKGSSEEDLLQAVEAAYREGWRRLKLYFMVGLPGEEEEDVEEICALVRRMMRRGAGGGPLKGMRVTVSVSTFVPKPHTPFQWVRQMSMPEIKRRHFLLREGLRGRGVTLRWHDREMSYLEGALSRGDRRLFPVILAAAREGCLDDWTEHFSWERWSRAFREAGLDPAWYVERERPREEFFPWDHLSCGVKKDFLWKEYTRSREGAGSGDCRFEGCLSCGACPPEEVKGVVAEG